ncbi:MAG: FHA domain-containing protein [Bdellovibrionota bacterium]
MSGDQHIWYLSGLNQEFKDQAIVLIGDEITLGRTEQNDVVLAHNNISRHHASIFITPKACHIQDMGSRNGTYVNGERIDPAAPKKIVLQDEIRIGQYLFLVGRKEPQNPMYAATSEKWLQAKEFVREVSKEFRQKSKELASASAFKFKEVQKKKKLEMPRLSRRGALYGVMFLVLAWVGYTSMQSPSPTLESSSQPSEKPETSTPISQTEKIKPAPRGELDSLMERAMSYVQFQDYAAAIPLLQRILATDASNEKARQLLLRSEKKLLENISIHRENGAREYEKLFFDRAIIEWKKAYSLAVNYNQEMASEIQTLIDDAEEKLRSEK